jgi:Domain of unknown function DUF1828
MNYMDYLTAGFGSHVSVREKRPGVAKLLVPLFHEDGDMVDIFLEMKGGDMVRVSDRGLSLMRLSYQYDIDTENKERIFRQILSENRVSEENGNLYLDVPCQSLYPAVLQFGQAIAKVCSMSLYRREVISNLFYEMLDEFVTADMSKLQSAKAISPIQSRDELEVDYGFSFGRVPVYLFGAKGGDTSKIRLITIACLEFQKKGLAFRSAVVHQDFAVLPKRDCKIVTSAVDKQFTSLEDFREHGPDTIQRLAA